MEQTQTKRYVLTGIVQKVGCRQFVVAAATARAVKGWVRNRPDGSVEIMAQATTTILADFEAQLRLGPLKGRVDDIATEVLSNPLEVYYDFKELKMM